MSRAIRDNSNPVEMFPFVAVLLCTMGSLLVILVIVARCSWDRGAKEASVSRDQAPSRSEGQRSESDPAIIDPESQEQLAHLDQYVKQASAISSKAQEQIARDGRQLSHLEDHMRRLKERLESLQLAAAELNGLEDSHFDDREQAEREVGRLNQLIQNTQTTIDDLRKQQQAKSKSFAIIPYKGKYGTFRPPIYIECRKDVVIIQPEGIELRPDDFALDRGPSSPLAAVLRAAREYIVAANHAGEFSAEAEPYPLIIVRPHSVAAYALVRNVIERCHLDFGYELVGEDWNVQFPAANPELAAAEYRAVELARERLKALAAAAPRARRGGGFAGAASFGDGEGGGDGAGRYAEDDGPGFGGEYVGAENGGNAYASGGNVGGGNSGGGGRYQPSGAGGGPGGPGGSPDGSGGTGGGGPSSYGNGSEAPQSEAGEHVASTRTDGTQDKASGNTATGEKRTIAEDEVKVKIGNPPRQGSQGNVADRGDAVATESGQNNDDKAIESDNGFSPPRDSHSKKPPKKDDDKPEKNPQKIHGKNWAILRRDPGAVPIRRTIQVVVRGDRIAILPDPGESGPHVAAPREFPLTGPTSDVADSFNSAVRDHIENWGIAGQGLYWRPVIELNVGPEAEQRARDLARVLDGSGMEVRNSAVAKNGEEANRATR